MIIAFWKRRRKVWKGDDMGSILVEASGQQCCNGPLPYTPRSINVTMLDLMRYSSTLGGISGRKISRIGRRYYRSLVEMALCEDGGIFSARNDYFDAEPSIKRAITFYLGMIAAKAVMEKKLWYIAAFTFKGSPN